MEEVRYVVTFQVPLTVQYDSRTPESEKEAARQMLQQALDHIKSQSTFHGHIEVIHDTVSEDEIRENKVPENMDGGAQASQGVGSTQGEDPNNGKEMCGNESGACQCDNTSGTSCCGNEGTNREEDKEGVQQDKAI